MYNFMQIMNIPNQNLLELTGHVLNKTDSQSILCHSPAHLMALDIPDLVLDGRFEGNAHFLDFCTLQNVNYFRMAKVHPAKDCIH